MEMLFSRLWDVFCLEYIFVVIIASYFTIKLIDVFNGECAVPTWVKRTVTFLVGTISFFVFRSYSDIEIKTLLASYFAAVFVYDTAIKWLIRKTNIDYKKPDDNKHKSSQ